MKRVPTTAELFAMGRHLAYPASHTAKGDPSTWRITAEGHALIGAVMAENAAEARAAGSADWVQPPSRFIPGITESPWQATPLPGKIHEGQSRSSS